MLITRTLLLNVLILGLYFGSSLALAHEGGVPGNRRFKPDARGVAKPHQGRRRRPLSKRKAASLARHGLEAQGVLPLRTPTGQTIRALPGNRNLSLGERRQIAVAAVTARLLEDGRIADKKDLRVFASPTDPSATRVPIVGEGLITVYSREKKALRFDPHRYQRAIVSVSPDGAETRVLRLESMVPHRVVLRALKRVAVNDLVADAIASAANPEGGVREAARTTSLASVIGGGGYEFATQVTDPETAVLAATVAALAVGVHTPRAVHTAIRGVRRRREKNLEAVHEAVRWANGVHRETGLYPTLGDAHVHYKHTLERIKEGTRPLPIEEFAEAIRGEWNRVGAPHP